MENDGLAGEVRLGAVSTALTGILPEVIGKLTTAAPRLQLKITPGSSRSLYEKVLSDELDCGLTVLPPFITPKTVRARILRSEPLVFLTKNECLSAQDITQQLLDSSFIRYDIEAWGGQIAQQYLNDNSLEPNVLCNLDALDAISILVKKGMGVSLVPAWAGMDIQGLFAYPVSNTGEYTRHVVLLTKATPRRPAALKLLEDLLVASSASR